MTLRFSDTPIFSTLPIGGISFASSSSLATDLLRKRKRIPVRGDQYTFIALAASAKVIVAYRTGKRDSENTDPFIRDLRERVLGAPEISTDGFHPYRPAIRDAFGERVAHGVINKTYSVTDLHKDAARRYSPAAVVAVSPKAVVGIARRRP